MIDVGFLQDPKYMLQVYEETPIGIVVLLCLSIFYKCD